MRSSSRPVSVVAICMSLVAIALSVDFLLGLGYAPQPAGVWLALPLALGSLKLSL
jgi:hypothetical protein